MDTRVLKHGAPARLFPVYPESCKEQRSISIVMAAMVSVKPFSENILSAVGVRVGKRSSVSCFTEVTLTNEIKGLKDRPDGLLVVETGKKSWSALIEAKVGKSIVEAHQLERYIELAKANNIDAVITVTNELTPAPSIHPTALTKPLSKNVGLYHFSWSSILTTAFLLAAAKESPFDNDDEVYIISELIRYLEHPHSGRMPLDQMNREWPRIVSDVQAGHPVSGKSEGVSEMISSWHQEARDIALIMTRKLGEPVSLAVSRGQLSNHESWVGAEIKQFCDSRLLAFELNVPNAADRISIEADFLRRAIRVSMKVLAPTDRSSNSARINWLLRQLQKSDLPKVIIRCITRGNGQNFGAMAHELDPKGDEIKDLGEIVSFQVEMSSDLGIKFNSRKKFIESLEDLVPQFYENIGQHLQAWVAPPPKLQTGLEAESSQEGEYKSHDESRLAREKSTNGKQPDRPDWANVWQTEITPESVGDV